MASEFIPVDCGLRRRLSSWFGNIAARYIAEMSSVRDCTAGFRVISAELLCGINLEELKAQRLCFFRLRSCAMPCCTQRLLSKSRWILSTGKWTSPGSGSGAWSNFSSTSGMSRLQNPHQIRACRPLWCDGESAGVHRAPRPRAKQTHRLLCGHLGFRDLELPSQELLDVRRPRDKRPHAGAGPEVQSGAPHGAPGELGCYCQAEADLSGCDAPGSIRPSALFRQCSGTALRTFTGPPVG